MITAALLDAIWQRPALWERLRGLLRRTGYDTTDWVRSAMYRDCFAFIQELGPETLDVLEISGGNQWTRDFAFKTYENTEYPGFDICAETLPRQFDLIIADQVFEHLPWPYRAGRNVWSMLKPGGHLVIATPFLVRIHRVPIDCSRWTPDGLKDPVIAGVRPKGAFAHWHGDTYKPVPGATLLASTDRYSQQAFRLGASYGFQFHPELTAAEMGRWLELEADDLKQRGKDVQELKSQLPRLKAAEAENTELLQRLAHHFAQVARR